MVHAFWSYKRDKARLLSASDDVNTVFFHDMEVICIDDWRVVQAIPHDNSGQEPHQQKQYHACFVPMIKKIWQQSQSS